MLSFKIKNPKFIILLLAVILAGTVQAQVTQRVKPVWWFGQSAAVNMNYYQGTTQKLDNNLSVPTAFHKGNSIRPYFSLLTEYRPNKVWGGMLNVAFDNRGGTFKTVTAPCNCPATLSTNLSYIAIEPSLRIAPFASSFYIFGGPTLGYNVRKEYTYKQEKQLDRTGKLSDIRKTVFSAQAGLGFDIPVSQKTSPVQMTLSPFASFQTDLGRAPRTIESWSMYTIRAGVALKFGKGRKAPVKEVPVTPVGVVTPEKEVMFSVRAPKDVPAVRQVKENLPLLNAVFFDKGSAVIPARYILLTPAASGTFKETQLQTAQPDDLKKGRAARQLAVYYNILNIIADRLRNNPSATITLSGASDGNPQEGKLMAENIKQYMVSVFGINASRINTEGTSKPLVPSEQPGATKELALLREGDRRVDIFSSSPELLLEVGGSKSSFLKPVEIIDTQADPLDSHVIFTATGASETLKWWSIEVTGADGITKSFGPFARDVIAIPGNTILGNSNSGVYKVSMLGETNSGRSVRKESAVALVKAPASRQTGMRYSILFDFDKSESITSYETFLSQIVAPLIPENGTVIIHGHTDIIGDEKYNSTLSEERAKRSQKVLEAAILKAGKKGVLFESYGFGEDTKLAPFDNSFPEERFYNRTVIIDIIPAI
jgi:outer membrane protein OmpA-like peptidoglycan-associated protein